MAKARLRRFEVTVVRRLTAIDGTQIPVPFGQVDFYQRGATVSADVTVPPNSTATPVGVFDTGPLNSKMVVTAGLGGPQLIVAVSPDNPTMVSLTNGTSSEVRLYAGTRLIVIGNMGTMGFKEKRPTVYADPFGTRQLGSSVTTDDNGKAVAYVEEGLFDYVLPSAVAFDSSSAEAYSETGTAMTWEHKASGNDRLVLVGISWRKPTATEVITGVTYGGLPMTPVASAENSASVNVYYLLNPPPGTQAIIVTWSESNPRDAVAGAVSMQRVHQSNPLGKPRTAFGSTSSGDPSIPLSPPMRGLAFDTVAIDSQGNDAVIDPAPNQAALWNGVAGDPTPIVGAASTSLDYEISYPPTYHPVAPAAHGVFPSPTSRLGTRMAWLLRDTSLTLNWAMVAVGAEAAGQLVIDAEGSVFSRSPFGVNVVDYQSLQDAVDQAPNGALVFLPAQGYSRYTNPQFTPPLKLPTGKALHLFGADGAALSTELTAFASVTPDREQAMLLIQDDHQIVEGLKFSTTSVPHPPSALKGVVLSRADTDPNIGQALFRTSVRRCRFEGIPSWNIRVDDNAGRFTVLTALEDINIEDPLAKMVGPGVVYIGGKSTTTVYLTRCRIKNFKGYGVQINLSTSVSLRDCIIEESVDDSQPSIYMTGAKNAVIDHCYFEGAASPASPAAANQYEFIRCDGEYHGLLISGCRMRRSGSYMKAVILDGIAYGGVILALNAVVPGQIANPAVPNVSITGVNSSVSIVGGVVDREGTGGLPVGLVVSDASRGSAILGGLQRLRMPRVPDQANRDALVNVLEGDIIYRLDTHVIQVWLGAAGWKTLTPT
jgi:hypothetical protein